MTKMTKEVWTSLETSEQVIRAIVKNGLDRLCSESARQACSHERCCRAILMPKTGEFKKELERVYDNCRKVTVSITVE